MVDNKHDSSSSESVVESVGEEDVNMRCDTMEIEESQNGNKSFSSLDEESLGLRSLTVPLWGENYAHFNPLTSIVAFLGLAGLAIWCAASPEHSKKVLSDVSASISADWVWIYIVTAPIFIVFAVFLALSKYGDIKLGRDEDEPEFDDASYFAMLFSAGVAVGMFFYGVSEPLFHLKDNRFAEAGYHSDDEKAQYAITLTLFHWGFAAWAGYVVVALAAGLACWRYGLPLTMRSCFYPLLGVHTWSWVGDLLDAFTILTVVSGVCTSLGLGAVQLVAGLQRIGAIDSSKTGDDLVTAQVITICVVTLMATASVVSGLDAGIKLLSQLALLTGIALWTMIFFLDDTAFLLDLIVQSTGQYFQWTTFSLNFQTDAFGTLPKGGGASIDGNSPSPGWMGAWTIFYQAWWSAWASFVGLFVARISKGRTIRSVVGYTFIGPLLYAILWFCVFGGVGLRQERSARELIELGRIQGNSSKYLVPGSTVCYMPPADDQFNGTEIIYSDPMPGIGPYCVLNTANSDSAWLDRKSVV